MIWIHDLYGFVSHNIGNIISLKVISSRLVDMLMKMCFYMERKYVPYSKWLETAFGELVCAGKVQPIFEKIVMSVEGQEIESALCDAYEILLELQNTPGITEVFHIKRTDYHGRPYEVVFVDEVVEALIRDIEDEALREMNIDEMAVIQMTNGIDLRDCRNYMRMTMNEMR